MSEEAGSSGAQVEASGETVGEAKWSALRELERRFPGIDKRSVRFQVVSEGERGLLGVGYTPARVVATLAEGEAPRAAPAPPPPTEEPGSAEATLRDVVERVCAALGLSVSVSIAREDSTLRARVSGPDLGLLIGKRGQTIDSLQYLASAIVNRGVVPEERQEVVVDAAGYRGRRQASLERIAERAAADVLRGGEPVALEPMTAVERKAVHVHLQDRTDVVTSSEGTEPNRHVVIRRADG